MKNDKIKYLEGLYKSEMLHRSVYRSLAKIEKDRELKEILERLAKVEQTNSKLWERVLNINKVDRPEIRIGFLTFLLTTLRRFVGLAMIVKFVEYGELDLRNKLNKGLKVFEADERERLIIQEIEGKELLIQEPLEKKILELNPLLNNIRDVIFGMNDGLVEVLAAVAGLGAAFRLPILVLTSGFIVAMSGTLSMAGGAYLSVEYEKSIGIRGKTKQSSPKRSAAYVGFSYIFGAMFPLLPFVVGYGGYSGIALSIIITAGVLTLVSTMISIISSTSIRGRLIRTLAISLGIAGFTMLIGIYARTVLNLPI